MKHILVFVILAIIVGCSNKPDKNEAVSQVEKELTSDVWKPSNVQYVNGYAKNENNYIVSVSFTRSFEKYLDEIYRENQELGKSIRNVYGNIEPGMAFDETADAKFVKSENGWIMLGWEAGPSVIGRNTTIEKEQQEETKNTLNKIQGMWYISKESNLKDSSIYFKNALAYNLDYLIIKNDRLFFIDKVRSVGPSYLIKRINLTDRAQTIDLIFYSTESDRFGMAKINKQMIVRGLFYLDDSKATLCLSEPDNNRPANILCEQGNHFVLTKATTNTDINGKLIGMWKNGSEFIELASNGKISSSANKFFTSNAYYQLDDNKVGLEANNGEALMIFSFDPKEDTLNIFGGKLRREIK